MLRGFVLGSLVMSGMAALLLIYQWTMFSSTSDGKGLAPTVEEQFDIEVEGGLAHIVQEISGLEPGQSYSLIMEDVHKDFKCELDLNKPCLLEDGEERKLVTTGNNGKLIFTYQFPIPDELVMKDWAIQLMNGDERIQGKVDVTLKAVGDRVKAWETNGLQQAAINKEYVDFYRWIKKEHGTPSLIHYDPDHLKLWKKDEFVLLYPSSSQLESEQLQELGKLASEYEDQVIVASENEKGISLEEIGNGVLSNQAFYQELTDPWTPLTEEERQAAHVISDAIHPTDEPKGNRMSTMTEMVTKAFGDEELGQLEALLIDGVQQKSFVNELDEALSTVKQMPTTFFAGNQASSEVIPLYFYDQRQVVWKEKVLPWRTISREGESFYPLGGVASAAGMEVIPIPEDRSYIVEYDNRSYRFYEQSETFITDEERFGLTEEAIIRVNEEIYIREQLIGDLFDIRLNESEDAIVMIPKK
ncbi:hypothetical protein [Thalassobacillus hwangdonensis]